MKVHELVKSFSKAVEAANAMSAVREVMEGLRGTQDMMVVGESAVSEASTPLDYVVSGSQVISVAIK